VPEYRAFIALDAASMLSGEPVISGPSLCRCLAVTPRKDAEEHQRDGDLHEDERHEK
jgi:hypothetical protein